MIYNPDGIDNKWYFYYNNEKIIPFLMYNSDNYDKIYYVIKNNKIEREYENQNDISSYLINKYEINENYYHPNEIIATILSEYIIYNKKIDKNLLHFIN